MFLYSSTTKGFYSDAVHGPRRCIVPDPYWVRPTIEVTLQPGELFDIGNGEQLTNAGATSFVADVPDMTWVAPSIEVDNPDCKIPVDAVEITDAQHAALLSGQSAGLCIVADEAGFPILVPPTAPTEDELAARARVERDSRMVDFEWRYERHARELRLGMLPTDDLAALDVYMQALSEITDQADFPNDIVWPEFPPAVK